VTSVVRHDVLLVIVYCRFILKLLQVHDLVDLLKWYYDQNFTPWFFSCNRIPWKNKNAVYHLRISALVPEIFVFEKYVKYANKMTDDVIYSTQYYTRYINRAILANLHHRPLKLGRLIVLNETHQWL